MLHFSRVFDGDDGRIAPRKTFTLNLCRCFFNYNILFCFNPSSNSRTIQQLAQCHFSLVFFFLVRQVEIGTHALNFLIQSHTNTHSAK